MTPFILISAVMLVAAIVLLALPLLRARRSGAAGEPELPRATVMTSVLIIGLPLVATALYAGISNFPWDDPQAAVAVPPGHGEPDNAGSMEEVTGQLEARLADRPDDREGWRMLGRTYLVTGQPRKAVEAYEKALHGKGERDPGLELDLAEALVLVDDPSLLARAKAIIDAALAADAMNQKALWYSGLMAARADDTATAIEHWRRLLETQPPEEIRQIVANQLQALGVDVPTPAAGDASPAPGAGTGGGTVSDERVTVGRTIRVAVSVDPAVAGRVKSGVPIFVSARQPGIPGPPLAAVRLSAEQLPTTVVLSDRNSMVAGRNLSAVDEVQLVARVAFGGTAVAERGDLVGMASHRKGAPADVSVVIDTVSP